MRSFLVIAALMLTNGVAADDHAGMTPGDGAFTTIMLQTSDLDRYISSLKSNLQVQERTGAMVAGFCVTKTGHDYPGQMMVWNGFASVADALDASTKYDAMAAPEPGFASLRSVQYSATWKPLKPFKLDPGYERAMRVVVPAEKVMGFVNEMTVLETAVRSAGHDMNIGVFQALGGGAVEANSLFVRSVARDAASFGRVVDDYFAGNAYDGGWDRGMAMVSEVVNDQFEQCEQTYTAK